MKVDYKDVQEDFKRYQAKIDDLQRELNIAEHNLFLAEKYLSDEQELDYKQEKKEG
jgi:hypothetical protein